MRKPVRNLLLGASTAAMVAAACLVVLFVHGTGPDPQKVLKSLAQATAPCRLKRYDEAIAHFQRILQVEPRDTDALVGLAGSYAATRQMDKALSCLEEALRIAQSVDEQRLAAEIARRIDYCRQRMPAGSKP